MGIAIRVSITYLPESDESGVKLVKSAFGRVVVGARVVVVRATVVELHRAC
jgi:hypothetical protein